VGYPNVVYALDCCPIELTNTWSSYVGKCIVVQTTFGEVTKGYKECHGCGPNIYNHHPKILGKIVYVKYSIWLWPDHPFHSSVREFNGKFERWLAQLVMTKCKILEHAFSHETYKLNDTNKEDNTCIKLGVKPNKRFIWVAKMEGWWSNYCLLIGFIFDKSMNSQKIINTIKIILNNM
jgi:hypothetical protein